jgi:hypothetical protein
MHRLTVQFRVNGEYGEIVARSKSLDEQGIADQLHKTAKPGVALRCLGSYGIIMPTG